MEPSWDGKSSQDKPRQAKTREEKGSEGKARETKRKGRDCKGKVWKSEAGVIRNTRMLDVNFGGVSLNSIQDNSNQIFEESLDFLMV